MSHLSLRGEKVWSQQWHKFRREPILLLHGGLSSTQSFSRQVLPALNRFHAYGYDRTAHGKTPMREGFYHFDFQCAEAIAYIEDVIQKPTHIIGHSDGGIIALMVAINRPDLVKTIVPIGANFHYNSGLNLSSLSIEVSEEDKDAFAERTGQDRELWVEIVKKANQVWRSEPKMSKRDLKKIQSPTLIIAGDDEPFSNEHTLSLYESIPNARLAIIPGTSHAVLKERPKLVFSILKDFYADPSFPLTKSPNRRLLASEQFLNS